MTMWRRSVSVVALAALLTGCGRDSVSLATKASGSDYGRAAVLDAIAVYGASDRTPADYRVMAAAIDDLRSQFDDDVAALAERNLVFLALGPLEAIADRPVEERQRALAVTVWPTALGVAPTAGEAPAAYTERVCGGDLALDCKFVIPPSRPVVLSALVWNRLRSRARDALAACDSCAGDPGYTGALERYADRERELSAIAGKAEDDAHPKHWPIAGANAGDWPAQAPVLAIDRSGAAALAGVAVAAGTWRSRLAEARGEQTVLAVEIPASAKVANLRAIAADAAASGFRELALAVHAPSYPFHRRGYRIALADRKATRVRVRDVDSIQVLVQALDAFAAGGAARFALR